MMRAIVLGFQFPGIGLGTSVSNQRKATKLRRWRVCVSSPPKLWAVGLLSSSASLLDDTAERQETQLFLFCNSKADSLLTVLLLTLRTYSQAQKDI